MHPRSLAAVLLVTVSLAACGGTDLDDLAADIGDEASELASEIGSAVDDVASELDDDDETEHEGEGRDPDALFGVEVCEALLPALDGDTEGLDRYADPDVLATLSAGSDDSDPISGDAFAYDGDGSCAIVVGDLTWTLELSGDGHVGDHAVAVTESLGIDSGGGAAVDTDAIAAEVSAYRGSGDACDGGAAELPEDMTDHEILPLDGTTVVAVVCDFFAYQNIYELLGWDGTLYSLEVEQWMDGVTTSPQVLGYPYVEDGQIANLEKARGIGDCGTFQTWVLGGSDDLVLTEARVRECDDDADYVDPTDWELVYVADV